MALLLRPARSARPTAGRLAPPPRRRFDGLLREPSIASALPLHPPASTPDADAIACSSCDAVCCRLTVVLMPGDDVPHHLTAHTDEGLHVMARDDEGWCVAVDGARMCCSIYETRPAICRKFAMGGPYCRDIRDEYADHYPREIALTLC